MRFALATCLVFSLFNFSLAQRAAGPLVQCEDAPLTWQSSGAVTYPITVDVVLATDGSVNALRATPIVRAGEILEAGAQLNWTVNLPARMSFLSGKLNGSLMVV